MFFAVKKSRSDPKERRERKKQRSKVILPLARSIFCPCVLANLEFVSAKVDQQPVPQPGRFQVAENLGLVFGRDGFGRLQFHDQPAINQQIGEVIANQGAILIIDFDRILLLDFQAGLL
jgi:hypothetical protein